MHVLVLGGGVVGTIASVLLARAGHMVTVLDRDAGPLPADADEANTAWTRAIGQFQRPHSLLPRGHALLDEHLPEVLRELRALGAEDFDVLTDLLPPALRDGLPEEPGDERFRTLATRRPTFELAVQRVAEREAGVEIHRDARVAELLVDADDPRRVVGAVTADGTTHRADVVVDAMGRRSPTDRLLEAAGLDALPCEQVELDFRYTGRFYRTDGPLPSIPGMLVPAGTVSLLTIPSDNGTWSVTVYTAGDDDELATVLKDDDAFEAIVRAHPSHAHLVDGEPVSPVVRMVSDAGKRRTLVADGDVVVRGLLPLGDAWASTNPSYGRGMTIGMLHALELVEAVTTLGHDSDALAHDWQERTDRVVGPWWEDTVQQDRARSAEIARLIRRAHGDEPTASGSPHGSDPLADLLRAFFRAAGRDGRALRGMLDIASCNALPTEVFGQPGFLDHVLEVGAPASDGPAPGPRRGPTRADLLAVASA